MASVVSFDSKRILESEYQVSYYFVVLNTNRKVLRELWIVQEIVLAKEVLICCGMEEQPWRWFLPSSVSFKTITPESPS
jgi:hypothetical protein